MSTESMLLQTDRLLLERPDVPPIVPRMIVVTIDPFGEQVLESLCADYLPALLREKYSLTALLHLTADQQARLALLEQPDPVTGTLSPQVRYTAPAAMLRQRLAESLYQARAHICAQRTYRRLQQRGWHIGPYLEIYVLATVKTDQQLELLREVVETCRSFIQQYEPVLLSSVLDMAALEQPLMDVAQRCSLRDGLDTLLAQPPAQSDSPVAQPVLDRCYIVTQETMRGRSVMERSTLVNHTAGFLAAHYLDGLRQPLTPHQSLLFGERSLQRPEISTTHGLCDVFGYAELRFEIDHILDWCAARQAEQVISQALLPGNLDDASAESSGDDLQVKLGQLFGRDKVAASAQELALHLRQIASAASYDPPSPELNLAQRPLRGVRLRQQQQEHLLQQARQRIVAEAERLQESMEQRLAHAIDQALTSDGLSLAEQQLRLIDRWCRDQLATLRVAHPTAAERSATGQRRLDTSWRSLTNLVMAMPSPTLFCVRAALLFLLAFLAGQFIGGQIGLVLAAFMITFVVAWLLDIQLGLPWRYQQAQRRFFATLDEWHAAEIEWSIQQQLDQLFTQVLQRFKRPTTRDGSSGIEQLHLDEWRRKLLAARELCLAAEQSSPALEQGGDQDDESIIRPSLADLHVYYRQLTTWNHRSLGATFLASLRSRSIELWRQLTPAQIATELRQVSYQRYTEQINQDTSSLEYYFQVDDAPEATRERRLDALIQTAVPLARLHRLHGHWKLPRQQVLVVHDANRSEFRHLAQERALAMVGGGHLRRMVCIWTEHQIPVRDLTVFKNCDWEEHIP